MDAHAVLRMHPFLSWKSTYRSLRISALFTMLFPAISTTIVARKLILCVSVEPGGENALSLARPSKQVYLLAQTLSKRVRLDITV